MAITISHQSMRGDLATAERGFVEQVADNTNIKICLRQSADAEYVAGLSGTYKTTKRTEQTPDRRPRATSRPGSGRRARWTSTTCRRTSFASCPRGHAVVQINAPATLDLVRLDHLDPAGYPPYSPLQQDRAPATGHRPPRARPPTRRDLPPRVGPTSDDDARGSAASVHPNPIVAP